MRVPPAFSVATSGAWRASTPISPSAPGTTSISASPSKVAPSGVTSETSNLRRSATPALLRGAARGAGIRARGFVAGPSETTGRHARVHQTDLGRRPGGLGLLLALLVLPLALALALALALGL